MKETKDTKETAAEETKRNSTPKKRIQRKKRNPKKRVPLERKRKMKKDEQMKLKKKKKNLAEFDNFRKNLQEKRKSAECLTWETRTIIEKILPVIDNFRAWGLEELPEKEQKG